MFDLSAAFDTVDHALLNPPSQRVGGDRKIMRLEGCRLTRKVFLPEQCSKLPMDKRLPVGN